MCRTTWDLPQSSRATPRLPVVSFFRPDLQYLDGAWRESPNEQRRGGPRCTRVEIGVSTSLLLPSGGDGCPEHCENATQPWLREYQSLSCLADFIKKADGPLRHCVQRFRQSWLRCREGVHYQGLDEPVWGLADHLQCLGEELLVMMHVVATFSRVTACRSAACEERRRALEEAAPACRWPSFREFVIQHLACWLPNMIYVLREMLILETHEVPKDQRYLMHLPASRAILDAVPLPDYVRPTTLLMTESSSCIDLNGVVDLLRWALRIACGPGEHLRLPPFGLGQDEYDGLEAIESYPNPDHEEVAIRITSDFVDLGLCPNRLWNVSLLGPRGIADIRHIASMMIESPSLTRHDHSRHRDCTLQSCLFNHDNSTLVQQAHKCASGDCKQATGFPPDLLNGAWHKTPELDGLHKVSKQSRGTSSWVPTSWQTSATGAPSLCTPGQSYMAISHVWSDGTGTGMKEPGRVNSCLAKYFQQLAIEEQCDGIWWDAISIPSDKDARKLAIDSMLKNYEAAKITLVHDKELVDFTWQDDGSPAVALVLSAWFTRGWTAAELFASRQHAVKVVFKNPDSCGGPLVKDLDNDILAWDAQPAHHHRMDFNIRENIDRLASYRRDHMLDPSGKVPQQGHFVASDIIRRLRTVRSADLSPGKESKDKAEIAALTDLREVLLSFRSRTTSWVRDRSIIPGLMCLPSLDSSASGPEITRQLMTHYGMIFFNDLLHGEVPMSPHGPWSWCPPSIFDLGTSRSSMGRRRSTPCYLDNGILYGHFSAFTLLDEDVTIPFGTHPATVAAISRALQDRNKCLLLGEDSRIHRRHSTWDASASEHAPLMNNPHDRQYILVRPVLVRRQVHHTGVFMAEIKCQWVGCVHLGSDLLLGAIKGHGVTRKTREREPLLQPQTLRFALGDNVLHGSPLSALDSRSAFAVVRIGARLKLDKNKTCYWTLGTTDGPVSSEVST